LKAYARYGIGEYWIVDPVAQTIEVYRLAPQGFQLAAKCGKDEAVRTPLLLGFSLPVGAIFKL
jgi:Uma2 family endonuclease